ncbi:MAG TPA: tetratricopeptide repeat protein [Marinilabiliaceae bacterium]|nr:tetratricopeptide repeat protein [Marinilabiliaceae bacterium]
MIRFSQYIFANLFLLLSLVSSFAMNERPDSLVLLPNIEETIKSVVDEGDIRIEQFVDSIKVLSSARAMKTVSGLINFYQGENAYENSQWDEAGLKYQKSLSYFQEVKDSVKLSVIHNNLGLVYFYQAFYDKALNSFQHSLEIDLIRNDRLGVAQCYQNIALVLETGKEINRGIEMYYKALEVYIELGAQAEIASIYNNLAACYARSERYAKAEEKYLQALAVFRDLKDSVMEAKVLYNVGVLMVRKKNFDQGGKNIERALVLFKNNNDKVGEVNAYSSLGDMYFIKKNYNQAIYLYNFADGKAKELNYRDLRLSNLFSLYSAYKLTGAWEKALLSYESYTELKDSLKHDNEYYESGLMDEATEQKLLNRELTLAKVQRRNHLFAGSFILAILLAAIGFVLAASNKRKLYKCHHNYQIQNRLMLNRINPEYTLPLLLSLNSKKTELEDKEQVINLIRNILQFSGARLIYIDQEIDFIRTYCAAYGVVNKMDIQLHIETNLVNRADQIMVPSMVSLFFLGAIIGDAIQEITQKITVNVGFIVQGEFLDLFLEDDGPTLSSDMHEIIRKHYLTLLNAVCGNHLYQHYKKLLLRSKDFVIVSESVSLGKESGNRLKIRLPLFVE